MKVLHLASWYPNEQDPYSGDFIQRHLVALSAFMPVTVVHLVKNHSLKSKDFILSRNKKTDNMEEWSAAYGTLKTGIRFFDQLVSFLKYKQLLKQLVKNYIEEKGRPDLIHVHVVLNAGIVVMDICEELNIPYLVTEHSGVYHPFATENLWNRFFYFRWISLRVLKNAALVTTVSAQLARQIASLVKIRKSMVITNTVDTGLFYYKYLPHIKPFRFIHVSGMTPAKNIENMLTAFVRLKERRTDWICTMVGPASDALKQHANELGLDAFLNWKGEVSYDEVARLMQESHVHVLFSRYENQPCVNLEAFCCGLPVIATRVGGIAEVVNELNGRLIEPMDISGLAQAMETMIDRYEEFDREQISEAAKNLYSYKVVGKTIFNAYQILMSNARENVLNP